MKAFKDCRNPVLPIEYHIPDAEAHVMPDGSEGVAVAEKPEGPFHNALQLPCGGIDPAIFIDEDGQAYYYWGQFYANGVKLKDNMVEFEEDTEVKNIVTEQEHFFHEDGTIQEACVTSQGAGRPFGVNKTIDAYRACGLTGSIYSGPENIETEVLKGLKEGDTAIVRYVEWDKTVTDLQINAKGTGDIAVYFGDENVGTVGISEGTMIFSKIDGKPGKHEVTLQFHNVQDLQMSSMIFRG